MAVNRKVWLSKCFEGPGGLVSWVVSFRRSLHQFENDEYKALLSLLSNVFICKDPADCRIWKAKFSCRSFSKALEDSPRVRTPSSLVWLGLAFLKWRLFAGLCCLAKFLQRTTFEGEVLCPRILLKSAFFVEGRARTSITCLSIVSLLNFHGAFFFRKSGVSWCMPVSVAMVFEA